MRKVGEPYNRLQATSRSILQAGEAGSYVTTVVLVEVYQESLKNTTFRW
jgi:hypothetical protein